MQTTAPPPSPYSARAGVLDRPVKRNALTRSNASRQETQHACRLFWLARTIRGIAHPIGEVFFALEKIAASAEDAAKNIPNPYSISWEEPTPSRASNK
jgi:hypothetical protein